MTFYLFKPGGGGYKRQIVLKIFKLKISNTYVLKNAKRDVQYIV